MNATASVGEDLIRRLGEVSLEEGFVISLYLDLDPSEFGTAPARASAIRSLLDEADRRARSIEGLSHMAKSALREDLERLEQFFAEDFSAEGTHGLAVFAAGAAELFEALPLGHTVPSQVKIGHEPHLAPLLETSQRDDRWLVLLVSRRDARILRGTADRLTEMTEWSDEVHGRHEQGGSSQARYQRSIEEQVDEHLRNVVSRLNRLLQRVRAEHLLVGCTSELWPQLEVKLDGMARERLAGHIEVDVQDTTAEDVLAAATETMEETEERREHALIERLREAVGRGEHASHGLADVLEALVQRRVETLLLVPDLEAPGVLCRQCGWMGAEGEKCPVDGSPLEHRTDIVEDAIAAAIQSDAQVVVVRGHREDLGPLQGVAALLRF